jgi:hypothetical protein
MSAIDSYLAELRHELPIGGRRRTLAEVEDHLREAASTVGEDEAVARFGEARVVAQGFRRLAALRVAALAVLGALAFPILTYPIVENALPPAPWPSADAMPDHLQWKLDAVRILFVVALVSAAAAGLLLRRGGRDAVVACAVVLAVLAHVGGLSALLSAQWEEAVPGTPGWLRLVAVGQLLATAGAAVVLVRAARSRPA